MKTRYQWCVWMMLGICLSGAPSHAAGVGSSIQAPSGASATAQAPNSATAPAAPAQSGEATRIASEWQGIISRLHLVVKIDQDAAGAFTAKLTSVDQGNVTIPIETVTFAADGTLRLELKSIKAAYEGKLSGDGSEIVGTWQQGGATIPLTFRRPGVSSAKTTLKPRTFGTVAFEPCRTSDGNTEGLCGKYEVYENRTAKSGRKIALNIMVLPSLSEKPAADPWFALAGGPGQSAVEAFPQTGFTAKVQQQRDVVLVDQRGTGGSNPLPCTLRDPNNMQQVIGEEIPVEKVKACRAELEKKADLTQYTTSIAMDDLDEVRQAMGFDKINVYGGSYGTRAGLVYLRRHGDHVRTLTLEGVAPPQYRIPLAFSKTTQNSVDQLIERCVANEACHKDFPELKKEFVALVDQLDKTPAHIETKNSEGETQQVTLSRGAFVGGLRPLLYIPEFVSEFPYMIHRASQGDWTVYVAAVTLVRNAIDKQVLRGMSFSVVCAEDVPSVTEEMIRRDTEGTYLGDFQVRLYQQACKEWARGEIPKDYYAPIRSALPTLLISGALDPATPPVASEQAARDLSNSRVVVVKDGTHGTGSPCIDGLIAEFVAQGSAAKLDATCVDQIHFSPFITQTQIDQIRQKAKQ